MTSSSWLAAALWCCAASAGELQRFDAVEPHMGTLVRISVYAGTEGEAKRAFAAAFARVAEVDAELSDYRVDSELNRLCAAPAGSPVSVSEDLFRVLEEAQRLAVETGGAFDVTLGPVIRLWREARREKRLPSEKELGEARSRSGYRLMRLDPATRTITLARDGMQLDLGAIGKGFAADEALAALERMGLRRALVAASGDLAIGDGPPGKSGWRVGVGGAGEEFARVLELRNAAVSTSGAAEQFAVIDGRRYSHIVDPATGVGLTKSIEVTVVARRGIEADSLATAVSVIGEERGRALAAKRPGVEVMVSQR
jgi:thiamine biosynthesis lipoprotein